MTAVTAAELRDAAVVLLKSTTISYPEWRKRVQSGYRGQPYDGSKTAWGKAFELLGQIDPSQNISLGASPEFQVMLDDIADWEKATFSWQEVSEDEVVIRLRRTA
jgi:hypothetical protein